ncbi:MAG: hypothetical protein U1E39_00120 [Planctomycetota bacterium]
MAKWMPRALAVAAALVVAVTVAQCALAPTGFGITSDVYRVRGRLVDAATGQPVAGVWVCPRPEAPGTPPDARAWADVSEDVRWAEELERRPGERPDAAQTPGVPPTTTALSRFRSFLAARTGPDGAFEAWLRVTSCHAVGGWFADAPSDARQPPELRSLWVVRDGDLVAILPTAGAWAVPRVPTPAYDEPRAALEVGDVRVAVGAPLAGRAPR